MREHGTDTLSFFKLRGDKHYLFNPTGTAFLGYRVESGVLMVSGDPVGERPRVADLLRELVAFAEARSLRIAALGVSAPARPLFEQAGLRALYMGDEAIVDTARSRSRAAHPQGAPVGLAAREGRVRAGLGGARRRSTTRSSRELEQVAERWRGGAPERGFCMAMDSLRNPHCGGDARRRTRRDGEGKVARLPAVRADYGRGAVSLSLMRRRHDAPNGMTEYMVVKAIDALRDRGVAEVSLNFAAFARLLREPEGLLERAAGRRSRSATHWFQIERLYRFNAKFFPRWEPRYFMYERALRPAPRRNRSAAGSRASCPSRRCAAVAH